MQIKLLVFLSILLVFFIDYDIELDLIQPIYVIGSLFENMDSITIQNKTYLFNKGTFPLSHFTNVTPNTDNKIKIDNNISDEQNQSIVGIDETVQNTPSNSNSANFSSSFDSGITANESNFWTMNVSDWISIVIGIIALVASLPSLLGIIISHLYKPNVDILIVAPPSGNNMGNSHYTHDQQVRWSDLKFLNIRNFTSRTFRIEIQINTKEPWKENPATARFFPHNGIGKGYPFNEGFWIKTDYMEFAGGGHVMGLIFPYTPEPNENTISITVNLKINLSEFGFPSFYGEINLKPIKSIFRVVTDSIK